MATHLDEPERAGVRFGHLTRMRSSRQLEAALWCRVDFRWLAEVWQLDHSTLSIFRKEFADLLQGINTQFDTQEVFYGKRSQTVEEPPSQLVLF